MLRVLRVVSVTAATLVALALVWYVEAFGSCEGWKGTETCPRAPFWDWESFGIAFWAGVIPTVAIRFRLDRVLRTLGEAAVAGAAVGAFMVVATGF